MVLGALLTERNVRQGFALLDQSFADGLRLEPATPEAFDLLLSLAQWVDLGYRDLGFFESQLAAFEHIEPLRLTLLQFTQWKLSVVFSLTSQRQFATALRLLEALLRATDGAMPAALRFVAHFWKGRIHRQVGEFDLALTEIRNAKQCASGMSAEKLEAVTKIHESWLLFHQGERRLAFELLDQAEEVLRPTGHALSLGNIAAARGRFVRTSGDHRGALDHFEQAIRIYREHYPEHLNLGRALVNAAYVKRLMALDLQPRLRGERASAATHAQSLRIAREAMDLLRDAARIYALHQHQSGSGSVLVNLGHLQLESGDIEAAADEAAAAFSLGEGKNDVVLMARARILQAYVQLAYSEEKMDRPAGVVHPAQIAVGYAEQGITFAQQTQNRRLLAGAYITRGLVATDDSFADRETARKFAGMAGKLLGSADDHDHLSRELAGLRLRITRSTELNDTLRQWADGELGEKSFQQIEEEFAEIVIPRVWQNLGRNVTLVAQQLSISPKKVRRILRSASHFKAAGTTRNAKARNVTKVQLREEP